MRVGPRPIPHHLCPGCLLPKTTAGQHAFDYCAITEETS